MYMTFFSCCLSSRAVASEMTNFSSYIPALAEEIGTAYVDEVPADESQVPADQGTQVPAQTQDTETTTIDTSSGESEEASQAKPVTDTTQTPAEEPTAAPAAEPVSEPETDPTEEPVVEPTAAPTEEPVVEPTEEPVVEPTAEPTEEPVVEPTAEPTEEPVAEPTAEPTEEPVAEPTAEPTEEPEAEATQEPEAMTLTGLSADQETVNVGDTVTFTFQSTGAETVTWTAGEASGTAEGGAFTWTPSESGVYTVTVTAKRGEETLVASTVVTVRDGELAVTAQAATAYGVANEKAIRFDAAVTGGVKPWVVSYTIEANGEQVYASEVLTDTIEYMPVAYGVHTLKVKATDAAGAAAEAVVSVPVAVNERESEGQWNLPVLSSELNAAQKLAAVAQSQLGYAGKDKNFINR